MENNHDLIKAYDAVTRDSQRRNEIKKEVYKVGYKKPPASGQFKKGQSGNPKGRKKKVLPKCVNEAIKLAFIKEITVTDENGIKRNIPMIQAFAQKIIQDAFKNDGPTRKMLMQNPQFMNFDFMHMMEEIALQDFEPEATKEQEKALKDLIVKVINNATKNENDNS